MHGIMYLVGIVVIFAAYVPMFLAPVMIWRACHRFRCAVRGRYAKGSYFAITGLAIVGSQNWRDRVEAFDVGHVELFAHRMRWALALFAIPALIAVALSLLP
jgi:hypothetical protein